MKPAGTLPLRPENVPTRPDGSEDGVAGPHLGSGGERRSHAAAGQRRHAADVGGRRIRRRHIDQIDRARCESETARHRQRSRRARWAGREDAAGVHGDVAHRAGAGERAAGIHEGRRRGDRTVDQQRAAVDRGWARVGVGAGERLGAGRQRQSAAGAADRAVERARCIRQRQRLAAEDDRAAGNARQARDASAARGAGNIEDAAGVGDVDARRRDAAVPGQRQRAGVDGGRAGIGVDAAEREDAAAFLGQAERAVAVLDRSRKRRGRVVAARRQRRRKRGAAVGDRAGSGERADGLAEARAAPPRLPPPASAAP